jgi:hypothetical protein
VPPAREKIYPDGFEIYPEVNKPPQKIRFSAATGDIVYRAPAYSDIDLNRHMNNTRYAQWVCDLFPTSRFENSLLRCFQVNYISDGIEGRRIALEVEEAGDGGSFAVRGSEADGGAAVFEAAGEWMAAE